MEIVFSRMKFLLISPGKPDESYIKEAVTMFTGRLQFYFPTEWKIIPPVKNAGSLEKEILRKEEGKKIIKELLPGDYIILLDEKGKQFGSIELASFIQKLSGETHKRIVFIIGGAFGVDTMVREKAHLTWSLSRLVFPHMLVRLILSEQLYRACTILRNEKYHHL